jgi:hypothetical protein
VTDVERAEIVAAAEAAADAAEPLTEAEQRFLRHIFAAPVAA